jgi:hypothetical protein
MQVPALRLAATLKHFLAHKFGSDIGRQRRLQSRAEFGFSYHLPVSLSLLGLGLAENREVTRCKQFESLKPVISTDWFFGKRKPPCSVAVTF